MSITNPMVFLFIIIFLVSHVFNFFGVKTFVWTTELLFTPVHQQQAKVYLALQEIDDEEEAENPCQDDELGEPVAQDDLGGVTAFLVHHRQLDVT